jgi:5-formyltetrahydrofolate cyclo-ligase
MAPDAVVKSALRKELRLARALASADPWRLTAMAAAAVGWLDANLVPGATVGLFWPARFEASVAPIIPWLWRRGLGVALPRVDACNELQLSLFQTNAALMPGFRGIPEPPADAPPCAPEAVAVLFVPGVGFDRHGGRLGQGGGHYDRLLASASPRPLTIGVAFEAQIVAAIPRLPHDIPVDAVLTERGLARVSTNALSDRDPTC